MNKIYQKMYPSAKNRSKDVLSGFMDKVILRGCNSGSRPFESIKRSGCRVKASRHDSNIRGCRVKTSRHDSNIRGCRVKASRHDGVKLGCPTKTFGHDDNIKEVILRCRYSGSLPYSIKHAGFTLIELLVVVLIIGILAAIALPQYEKAVARSRAAEAVVTLTALEQAQQRYYMANGTYTTDLSLLDIQIKDSSSFSYSTVHVGEYWRNYAQSQIYGGLAFEFSLRDDRLRWCLAPEDSVSANAICATYGKYDHSGNSNKYYLMK